MPSRKLPKGIRKHTTRAGYEYRFTLVDPSTGVTKRHSVYRPTLADSIRAKREIENRLDRGFHYQDSRANLGEWAKYWISGPMRARGLKTTTLDLYSILARKHLLQSPLAGTALRDIRPTHIEAFFVNLADSGLSNSTRRSIYSLLSHIIFAAVNDGLIVTDPMKGKVKRAKSVRSLVRFLSNAEVGALYKELRNSRHFEYFRVLLLTGLRRGEGLALDWESIDFERKEIHVKWTLTLGGERTSPKSDRSRRTLDMTQELETLFLTQKLRQHNDLQLAGNRWAGNPMDLVFTSQFGTPLSGRNILRVIQAASVRAGIDSKDSSEKVGAHTIRHVVATRLLDAGVPMHVVSRVLGHDSIDTTVDVYGHLAEAGRKSAMEQLSRLAAESDHSVL